MEASRSVFAVYELLESIFLHLPLYDLLLASRVSNQWEHVVSTSPEIRARLLSERLPSFVTLVPGVRDSDDLCNATKDGPWFFRTAVPDGSVLILKIANEHVQLFVPSDVKCAVHLLDPRRTRGAFHINYKIRRGWANFYDVSGDQICRKTTSRSPWSLPTEKPESIWDFVRKFNEEENRRYRQWTEKVCERDDWDKLFDIRPDKGYWL